MDMTEIVAPKWALATKRGWGMLITFLSTMLPVLSVWLNSKGYEVTLPMVAAFGESVGAAIDSVAAVVGVGLWIWGSFRPTAPITLMPPKQA